MLALFTDFGLDDPYVGQLHAAILAHAPNASIIDLFHNVPVFDIRAAAYLLPAYTTQLPADAVVLAVIDPGVGTRRRPLIIEADGRWYVGPDNGLFELVVRRAHRAQAYEILWRPDQLSTSFHGRDLFAPIAAQLACGMRVSEISACECKLDNAGSMWPDDYGAVLYIDHYGNAITGLRAESCEGEQLIVNGHQIDRAETFGAVDVAVPLWYENANGLVEIACNQRHAADCLGLAPGDAVQIVSSDS